MNKLLIALLIALPITSIGGEAQKLKYNYMTKEWHYAPANAVVVRNYMTGKWEMASPNSTLERNPTTHSYEYVAPSNSLPFNDPKGN